MMDVQPPDMSKNNTIRQRVPRAVCYVGLAAKHAVHGPPGGYRRRILYAIGRHYIGGLIIYRVIQKGFAIG